MISPPSLLLDMDSFIFETRSLYEIMGKFLVELFRTLFGRAVTEADLQAILSASEIDTRWIAELREIESCSSTKPHHGSQSASKGKKRSSIRHAKENCAHLRRSGQLRRVRPAARNLRWVRGLCDGAASLHSGVNPTP